MKRITRLLIAASIAVTAFTFSAVVFAAEPINTLDKKGLFGFKPTHVAIRGYDTVAYFTQEKPVKGLQSFSMDWQGASWQFASQKHLDLFKSDPEKYAPQYGGYCAYGVAKDGLVKIEPENWSILDGKLYLNYNDKIERLWLQDTAGFIKKADSKFEALLKSN